MSVVIINAELTAAESASFRDVFRVGGIPSALKHQKRSLDLAVMIPRRKPFYSETFIEQHIRDVVPGTPFLYVPWFFHSAVLEVPQGAHFGGRLLLWLARVILSPFAYACEEVQKRRVMKFLREKGTRVVLAEFGPVGVAVRKACLEAGVPLVVHFHGFDAYKRSILSHYGKDYGRLFQDASAIVAPSRDMIKQLAAIGAPARKLHYNPIGIDMKMFGRHVPAVRPPVFISVGRFVSKKAPEQTILAFSKVFRQCPDTRLVMIGRGPLLEKCRRLSVSLGIDRAVEFPGALSHSEVARRMREAAVFVQHSIVAKCGDAEGTPMSVIEAQASGLPAVVTRHMGIKDVVIDGVTGFMVSENDVDGMAQAMLRLMLDEKLAFAMGKAAHQNVARHFSMERGLRGLRAILTSASVAS
jgi:glycosyltransferase involved in cell wall biosynthesis